MNLTTSLTPVLRWRFARSVAPALKAAADSVGSDDSGAEFDPITAAAIDGRRQGHDGRRAERSINEHAKQIFEEARRGIEPDRAIEDLLRLVRDYPEEERFQIFAARLLEARHYAGTADIWMRLLERLPRSHNIIIENVRRTLRNFGIERAYQLVERRFPTEPSEPDELLLYARLLEEIGDFDAAEAAIERLLAFTELKETQIHAVALLYRRRGELLRAQQVAKDGRQRFAKADRLDKLVIQFDREITNLAVLLPVLNLSRGRISENIFGHALETFSASRSALRDVPEGFIGSVVLLGGSLAAGGAERQFTNTALTLARAVRDGERIADLNILGPVQVICRILFNRPGADFFLTDLAAMGIPVEQYLTYADFGGRAKYSAVLDVDGLLNYLPAAVAEATRKLTDVLTALSPQVVHIWQDGTILATLLAALIARVPRIVLAVRTVPPVDRPERNRPEYETLYRAVLRMVGVRLTANSRMAAQRYAEWLEVDPDRIGVVYNGVVPLSVEADDGAARLERECWPDATAQDFVVGTVMRFDENKRPYLWLEAAQIILEREVGARFILVGEGPLWEPAQELARRRGIANRFLFVGRSRCVGYWLSRMSVFLLLSRHEGLPNVLIEAQFSGVPVVSTPAGGAAETFLDGETGTLLPTAGDVEPADIADAVLAWKLPPEARHAIGARARDWSRSCFSVESMIDATVRAYRE